ARVPLVEAVPVADVSLAVLPAQVDLAAIAQVRKVYEPEPEVLRRAAELDDLLERVLHPFGQLLDALGVGAPLRSVEDATARERGAVEDRDVIRRQERRRARAARAGAEDQGSRLGDREIHARQAKLGRRGELPQSRALGRVRGLPGRHRKGREPTSGERLPEVGAELRWVPAHEPARLAGAGDSRHDLRHLRERRHAVKDAADLLELATEALE